jgi:hypothetical protein
MITNYESRYSGMTEPIIDHFEVDNNRPINLSKIDNIKFDGIDKKDYPDFPDCCIVSADMNGHPMSSEELDNLNENYGDWIYERIIESIF